jgi:hypothetical protein
MLLIGLGVFIACLIVSRFMSEAAYKHLDKLQKGDLVEQLSGLRKYSLLAFLPIGILMLFDSSIFAFNRQLGQVFTWVLLIAWIVGLEYLIFRKMKAIPLPEAYLKAYYRGRAVLYVGFFGMFGLFIVLFSLK